MNETRTQTEAPAQRRRPVTLTRRHSSDRAEMLRRVVPDAVADSGVSPLDVCGFQSAI